MRVSNRCPLLLWLLKNSLRQRGAMPIRHSLEDWMAYRFRGGHGGARGGMAATVCSRSVYANAATYNGIRGGEAKSELLRGARIAAQEYPLKAYSGLCIVSIGKAGATLFGALDALLPEEVRRQAVVSAPVPPDLNIKMSFIFAVAIPSQTSPPWRLQMPPSRYWNDLHPTHWFCFSSRAEPLRCSSAPLPTPLDLKT